MVAWLFSSVALATSGTANIPVEQLLELHDKEPETPRAPVAGVLDQLTLSGRLLDDALEVQVAASVSILEGEGWTQVPLLDVGPRVALVDVPSLEGAWLAVVDGTLTLVANKAATHSFQFELSVVPRRAGARRDARLQVRPATAAAMTLDFDPSLVKLLSSEGASGRALRPRAGAFEVAWRSTGAPADQVRMERPVIEPQVQRAHSSVVSTLEGTWLVRTRYELRFEGQRELTLSWPADHVLQRVYVNGAPVVVSEANDAVTLAVSPARSGGNEGSVELVLAGEREGYLLQGTLDLELPRSSWPVSEWSCDTHLPEVFNYAWKGGSMQQAEGGESPTFAFTMPTPGKATRWRQELVFGTPPSLRIGYTVDLEGSYFRPYNEFAGR
ncbi:MAG: hypothetical protein KTR31_17620 [Myxococcales bacterium]|nr:hypothetical protein [Myxococcales bacterium]